MRSTWNIGMAALAALLLLGGNAVARSPILKEIEDAFIRLHQEVRPSVVTIDTKGAPAQSETRGEPDLEDLFRFFGVPEGGRPHGPMRPMPRTRATGSGFIYDTAGHIVTNNHVVDGADSITVRLSNGSEYPATVVGQDPDTDLAVIKIEADEVLPAVQLGDSDELKVGQFAIALGSPRGFEGSLSFGHISALGRENLAGLAAQGLRFQNLIQTDAAINLGNSGGPLVNIDGEVVGINIAIVWGANSLGFAIPVNTAKRIVPELIEKGSVTRGYLGVQIMDAAEFADSLGLPDKNGAFVKEVQPNTPAARADLKTYDVIRRVNGKDITNAQDLVSTISAVAPGETVKLEIWRDDALVEVDVQIDEWSPDTTRVSRGESPVLGLSLRALAPEVADRLGLEKGTKGVLVTGVEPGSAADDAGLRQGDVITEVARKPVSSPEEFKSRIDREREPGKSIIIRFIRGSADNMTVIEVPKE